MNIRKATKLDIPFLNKLCQLSWQNKHQWIGYPRVMDLDELLAEIKEHDNTLEDSVLIIEDSNGAVGFTGFLYEPGDEDATIIGPVLTEAKHNQNNIKQALEEVMKESTFDELFINLPTENKTTNAILQKLGWTLTHEQYEMSFDLNHINQVKLKHSIELLSDKMIKPVAQLFEKALQWKNAKDRLNHYVNEFGMDVAYIEKDGTLMGAVMWHDLKDTDFVRLEDVAVFPEGRRQGIATDLIHYVLNVSFKVGNSDVFLAVDHDNIGAQKLYKKLGFETTMLNCSYEY
ncbi:GNAT family N-acetyltransferase [Tenuibacillus multivorans]|uniref:Acetyltransferase (GNAT) family protein n=1 Tax=Tenuibacillus multivorans TaxID=237069 RepID=A0A1G9WF44_9BACI|nr:GNAT family N-acetyltransferase [Tenuibacillus multivorans]GEL76434.1 hypothetical protein TMU01_06690 [Tenuibacillus multivorans]SDM83109.1 Acetyltransferase (GNAT) family protein [Tenuibacillus multivorans]